MKIAVMSDFHFGYSAGTELEQDAFEAVEQALEASAGCDLIIMPGDLFDTRVPSTETLAKAMQLMIKPSMSSDGAKFLKFIGKDGDGVSPRSLSGIPIVTIHGTHERRTKELMNPVQALEKAGFAIHLHCNGVVFEKNQEGSAAEAASDRVAVFGLSGVPDQYAEKELKDWNPKPEAGCYNIFMLHQNIREFMPPQIEHAIKTAELPDGFDLYLCGHIHEARKAKKGGKPFLFPGSLIPTQLDKASEKPRGFFIVDTKGGEIDFMELEGQRKVFVIEAADKERIEEELEKVLAVKHLKKPLVRVRLPAGIEAGFAAGLRHRYEGSAIISFKQEAEEAEAVQASKTLEQHVLSVQDMGRKLLEKNLADFKLDPQLYGSVFELLTEGRMDEAQRLVLGGSPVSEAVPKQAVRPNAEEAFPAKRPARKRPQAKLFDY